MPNLPLPPPDPIEGHHPRCSISAIQVTIRNWNGQKLIYLLILCAILTSASDTNDKPLQLLEREAKHILSETNKKKKHQTLLGEATPMF